VRSASGGQRASIPVLEILAYAFSAFACIAFVIVLASAFDE
jgi:hypothetical protein